MAQAITIQIYRGEQLVSTQTFDRDVIKIGRLPSAQLRLDDLKVARIHAVIELPSGGKEFFLQDMGSTDGTFLNGEKVKRVKLKEGDQIIVGETRLVVLMGARAGAQPGMMQPGMMQPGMMQPGMQQPMMQPGMQPGMMQPGMQQPMMQPGMQQMQPGMMQPGMMQPGMMQPGMQQPGMMQPGMMQPGMQQPGMMQPGMMQPGMQGTSPGAMMPNMGPGGTVIQPMPNMQQPNMQQQGMQGTSPGTMNPGMMQPGMQGTSPGTMRPQQPVQAQPQARPIQPQQASMTQPPADGGAMQMPNFDPRTIGFAQPLERLDHNSLQRGAFDEGVVHELAGVQILPEPEMTNDNRALELRMYWGDIILDINHLVKPKQITIGETKRTDIFISSEGLPKEEFPLIRYIEDQYVLTFFNDLEGEVQAAGELKPLKDMRSSAKVQKDDDMDGCYRLNLSMDSKAIVHWGGLTLAMRFVPPPVKMTGGAVAMDFQFLNIFVIVLFLSVGSIFSLSLYPYEAEALNEELMKSDNKFAQFILEPPKPPEQVKQTEDFMKRMEEQAKGPSKAKAEEGKFGKDKAEAKDAHSSVKAVKPDDKEVIKNSGIFKALGAGGFSTVIGSNSGLGGDVQNALGNLTGKTAGDSGGLGGLGLRGTGPGGGGIGDSIGLAKGVSTSGRIGGTAAYGSDQGKLGAKRETDVNIADAPPVVQGSLDPALIKKVIQENRNAIKYCFDRELQVKKDLAGIIKTQFIISPGGSVSMSMVKESTMKNKNVEDCIAGKIRALIFPKPKGGGIVIVNYPFVFKSSGG